MPVMQKGLLLRLKPKNDFVLIKRIEEHASSVIQTPDQYKQRGDKAIVISVGDARIVGSLLIPIEDLRPEQVIVVSKVGGTNMSLNGQEFELIRYGDVMGVLSEDEDAN